MEKSIKCGLLEILALPRQHHSHLRLVVNNYPDFVIIDILELSHVLSIEHGIALECYIAINYSYIVLVLYTSCE